MENTVKQLAKMLASSLEKSKRLFIVTGAGMSADSGLPTYRGIGGLYDNKETEDGMPIERALSGPVFQSSPEITWKYLAEIEAGARHATFNRGHEVLAEMESQFEEIWILTQNVDGFHTSAGSTNVIEIHGNLHRMRCTVCNYSKYHSSYEGFELPPYCPECNQLVRPDVVLFEEQLPVSELQRLYDCAEEIFDMVISIGTSSYFPYITQPVVLAAQAGVPTVEINPGTTTISDIVDLRVQCGAAEALNDAWELVMNQPNGR